MTAKEMFEKLGYIDKSEDYFNIIHYEKIYKDGRFTEKNIIEFDIKHEILCTARYVEKNYGAFYFEDGLLQAINKQIEELGWNNETTI